MKSAMIAGLFLAVGLYFGSSLTSTVHAQNGLRTAHIIEVNMNLSDKAFTFNGTPLNLTCVPTGKGEPRCYVLVKDN